MSSPVRPNLTVVTLGVEDLPRAVRFYRDGLGWPLGGGGEGEGVAFFALRGVVLALFGRKALAEDAGVPDRPTGFAGISLAVNVASREEADAVMAHAQKAGARVVKAAQPTFWGGYAGYFADPDGHLWEVAHNPFWTLDGEGKVAAFHA